VRMMVPPINNRRAIDRELSVFFRSHRPAAFNRAIARICRYFGLRRPRIRWFEYIDWGKTAGKTYEDGRIHLVHPENWKRGRVYNRERMWIQMVYHEMGHYLFWADAERKADVFMRRMVTGLRAAQQRTRRGRRGLASARAAARRRVSVRVRGRRGRSAAVAQKPRRIRRPRGRAA
jgi:hypothetical protein